MGLPLFQTPPDEKTPVRIAPILKLFLGCAEEVTAQFGRTPPTEAYSMSIDPTSATAASSVPVARTPSTTARITASRFNSSSSSHITSRTSVAARPTPGGRRLLTPRRRTILLDSAAVARSPHPDTSRPNTSASAFSSANSALARSTVGRDFGTAPSSTSTTRPGTSPHISSFAIPPPSHLAALSSPARSSSASFTHGATNAPTTRRPMRVARTRHTPARSSMLVMRDSAAVALSTLTTRPDTSHPEATSSKFAFALSPPSYPDYLPLPPLF